MSGGVTVLVAVVSGLIVFGSGSERPGLVIGEQYDAAGNPSLSPHALADGPTSPPRWGMCAPDGPCHQVASSDIAGDLSLGPTAPGTRFTLTETIARRRYTASEVWAGRLTVVAPPRPLGPARVGARIAVGPASWRGGWPVAADAVRRLDDLSIDACPTRDGRHGCLNLTPPGPGCKHSSRPASVPRWVSGWYLFAVDERQGTFVACTLPGFSSPLQVPTPATGPTVARSGPDGPIAGPPAPTATILPHPIRRGPITELASVHCPQACSVSLNAISYIRLDRSPGFTRTITGTRLVGVATSQLFGPKFEVTLQVGDGPKRSKNITLPGRHLVPVASPADPMTENQVPPSAGQALDGVYLRIHRIALFISVSNDFTIYALHDCFPLVTGSRPSAGQLLPAGSTVALRIRSQFCPTESPTLPNTGLPTFRVPDFIGTPVQAAIAWIDHRGLYWTGTFPALHRATRRTLLGNYRVIRQDPPPGSLIREGVLNARGFRPTPLVLTTQQRTP